MPVFSFFVHFFRLISTKIRIIWKPYGGKEQFRSELAKKGRAWARAGSGGLRMRAAGLSPCGPIEAMTAFCLTTVRLALARLKGRSSPSSSRCRSLFRHPERRNCSFPTGLPHNLIRWTLSPSFIHLMDRASGIRTFQGHFWTLNPRDGASIDRASSKAAQKTSASRRPAESPFPAGLRRHSFGNLFEILPK